MQFNALYCNLIEAGEQGGILEQLLERLALYEEKTMQLKQKIKSLVLTKLDGQVDGALLDAVIARVLAGMK